MDNEFRHSSLPKTQEATHMQHTSDAAITSQSRQLHDEQKSDTVLPPFDYDVLSAQDRQFVLQKTAETQHLLRQTAEGAIAIGNNLQAVRERLPHGQFMQWVQSELGMKRQTCQNFLNLARVYTGRLPAVAHLPLKVLYELAAAPEEVRFQVETAQIPSTVEAIREAKAALKAAQEAERQARAEAQATRQALLEVQTQMEAAEREQRQLQHQLTLLQEERDRLLSQEPQVREIEVEKPVVPPEIEQRMRTLEVQIMQLTNQRDTLSRQLTSMGEQAREAVLQRNAQTYERQFRQRWRKVAAELEQSSNQFLAHLPSSLELEGFEMQDWATLEHIEALLPRLLEAIHHFHDTSLRVVDAV